MMKKTTRALAFGTVAATLVLSGCAMQQTQPAEPKQVVIKVEPKKVQPTQQSKKPQLIKIVGIGYGSESTYEAYTPGQRRLMAIRASKLDAYRSLAEQIYGIKIDSNTTVSAMMAKNDSFRARVNAVVRGARIVSVTPMADHNYETVLEVYVDKSFFRKNFVYTGDCPEGGCYPEEAYQPIELNCDARMNCTEVGQQH